MKKIPRAFTEAVPAPIFSGDMPRKPVCIIIVARNNWEQTRSCLDSLLPTLGVRDQVIVADDGSSDGTGAGLARYLRIEVDRSEVERGVVAARDDAVVRARHELVVLLQPATVLTAHWLDPLVRVLDNDRTVRAAGPCTNGPPGPQAAGRADYVDRRAMRTFARSWCAARAGETSSTDRLEDFCVATRRDATGDRLVICRDSFVHRSDVRSGPPLVSACLITKNEEADITDCLTSLRGLADETVIYDTGSTDATVEIARGLGATVIEGYWDDDFARARNAALVHCRGEWIAWLDADETLVCDDIEALRQLLVRTKPHVDAWSVSIHNLTGVGVGAMFVHCAPRLFRREGREWAGRLHEQVVHPGHGIGIRQAVLDTAHLRHTGYLDETWLAKDKSERNLRIAAAEAAADDGLDRGLTLLNLGRSKFAGGFMEEAIGYFREAVECAPDPMIGRVALRTGAEGLLHIGRTDEALEWVARLRPLCTNPVQADRTEANIRIARREYEAALACLDRVGAGGRDEDGFSHGPEQLAAPRAAALVGLGRPGEAADVLLASLAANATLDRHLGDVLAYLQAAGRPANELAAVIPAAKAPWFLAQVLQLQTAPADTLLDACYAEMTDKHAVLAAAATLARGLDVERALVWSARLRGAGHADACPLVAQAVAATAPVLPRARAALVAYRMFGDDRAYRAYEAVAVSATTAERALIRAETLALCPGLTPLLDRPVMASPHPGTVLSKTV